MERSIKFFRHGAFLPSPDRRLGDGGCTQPSSDPQNDTGTPDVFLLAVVIMDDRPQLLMINWTQMDGDAYAYHVT